MNNPRFKRAAFEGIRKAAGLNTASECFLDAIFPFDCTFMNLLGEGVPMAWSRMYLVLSGLALLGFFSTGCIPTKQARVAAVALTLQDVARAAAKQSEPGIVRDGSPAYLMLLDGLLEEYPTNKELLIAACQANGSYASTFLAEGRSEEAQAVYKKAKLLGFKALTAAGHGDFEKAAAGSLEDFDTFLKKFKKKDVPELFWTASAWASSIAGNPSSVESLADIPMLKATIERVLKLDEGFYHGGPHLLMGVYYAAIPSIMGGDLKKAKDHFERAFALGSDKVLMAYVFFAEYYARGAKDESLYVKTLQDVLSKPADTVPELTLANVVAKKKAKLLLDKRSEYFDAQP
jgi:tetratricopeptide (TPR) repeat protein